MRRFLRNIHWGDKLIDILVVVLGITIALWVNNWNQGRQNAQLEQQYLKNLKEDLVKDSVSITGGFQYMDSISFSMSRIYRLADDEKNADSVALYLMAFGDDYLIFKPEEYTYEALRQTGNITVVQSDSIRKMLAQLYDTYEFLQIQVDLALEYQYSFMIQYQRNYDYWKESVIDAQIYKNPEFKTNITFYGSNLRNRRQYMREALDKIHILTGLIEQELDE